MPQHLHLSGTAPHAPSPKKRKGITPTELCLVAIAAAIITYYSIDLAYQAYMGTPDIACFYRFAEPETSKCGTKAEYLFGPVFFELPALLTLWLPFCPKRIRDFAYYDGVLPRRLHAYFALIFLLAVLGVVHSHSSRALQHAEPWRITDIQSPALSA